MDYILRFSGSVVCPDLYHQFTMHSEMAAIAYATRVLGNVASPIIYRADLFQGEAHIAGFTANQVTNVKTNRSQSNAS